MKTKEESLELLKKWFLGERVSLSNANLENANLWGANLGYAHLINANLINANLRYANLEDANLEDANLGYAHLENADLENANLKNANLENAQNIFLIQGTRDRLVLCGKICLIGCVSHDIDFWLENYEEIGNQYNYTPEQIKEYGEHIRYAAKWRALQIPD